MAINPQAAGHMGDPMRMIRDLSDRIDALENALSLESASIGERGLDVRGGSIVIYDAQGTEIMRLSTAGLTLEGLLSVVGRIIVQSEDGIEVIGGGSVKVNDGGAIIARHEDGSVGAVYGDFSAIGTGGLESGIGLLVQDNDAGGNLDIFRAKRDDNGDTVVIAGSAENNVGFFQAATDSMTLSSDINIPIAIALSATDVIIGTDSTTGSSANMHLSGTTSGVVSRVTSARRYKQDIADLKVDSRTILDLKPRTWRDVGEIKRDPETSRWHVGYIAEELDEIGLGAFVDYDEHGNPDSIEYDRLIIPLVEQVKELTRWAETQGFRQDVVAPTDLPKRTRSADGGKLKFIAESPSTDR